MQHSESITKLAVSLVAAQEDIRAVEKSATNPHFKSKYVPLDALIAMARPALKKHQLAVLQSAAPFEDGKGLLVETRIIHESGEWISGVVFIPIAKQDAQGAGASLTYGKRFGLSALLFISSDEDDDGNQASGQGQRSSKAASRAAANTPLRAASAPKEPPATEDQITAILDLAKDDAERESLKARVKGISTATAKEWIEKLEQRRPAKAAV